MKEILALLLLASLCLAISEPHPKDVGASEVSFSMSWVVDSQADTTLKVFPFQNTSQQSVSITANKAFSFEKDAFGNEKLVFKYQGSGKETIEVNGTAAVDYSKERQKAPADVEKFIGSSHFVIKSPQAKAIANEVTKDAKDDFEKLVMLTEWVHNYVQYDETYFQVQETSEEVLQTKRGVCDEYSHLLLALLREENIPARFVAGYVFSGKAWDAHAWTEAIIQGEVIPADATYNEVGLLDGTHLKFSETTDQSEVTEEITATAKLEKPAPFFEITMYSKPSQGVHLEFVSYPKQAGKNEVATADLQVQSQASEWLAVPLTLVVPTLPEEFAMQVLNNKDRLVYLRPNQGKTVSWQIKFSPNLKEDFVYNFTSYAVTLGQNASFTTVASAKNPSTQTPVIEASPVIVEEKNGKITLKTTLTNKGNAGTVVNAKASLGESTQSTTLEIRQGESKELELTLDYLENTAGVLVLEYPGHRINAEFSTQARQEADYTILLAIGLAILLIALILLKR